MVINSKIFIKSTAKEFDCSNFVMIDSRIFMSDAFFWLDIIIYEVFVQRRSDVQRKSVGLAPVINF